MLNAASEPAVHDGPRIVVVREAGALTAADADVDRGAYLDDPLDTSVIVLVGGGGTIPAALTKKLKEVGAGERAPDSEKTTDVLRQRGAATRTCSCVPMRSSSSPRTSAKTPGAVGSLVDVLRSAYGDGATLDADDVEPYLGEAGAVPVVPAHERDRGGRHRGARSRCCTGCSPHRTRAMPEPMHPLQVLGIAPRYYRRLLRLDDESVQSSADAIAALGGRVKEFPARKALEAARALGTDGIRQAFDALAPGRPRHQGRARHPAGRGASRCSWCAWPACSTREWSRRREAPPVAPLPVPRAYSSVEALARFIMRDVRRAAWLLWITALGAGLAQALLRGADQLRRVLGAGVDRLAGVLDAGLELGAHADVALAPALVLSGSASSGS